MTSNTIVRSWPAIGLGVLFALGTGYVLTEDLWHGARFTTAHLMTILAIVGTIAAGHGAWPRLIRGEVLAAAALGLIFVGGTFVIVTSAAGRNAEVQQTRAAAAAQRNAERADADAQIVEARNRLRQVEADRARECATGKGVRCTGWQATVEAHSSHVALAEARRAMMGGVEQINGGYAHAAAVYGALLGADPAKVERTLMLAMPFALTLICEFGCVVFLGIGLGHSGGPTGGQRTTFVPPVPVIEEEPKPNVVEFAKRFEEVNKRRPTVDEIAQACNLPRTTAWRLAKKAA